jgi:hypothetical protein
MNNTTKNLALLAEIIKVMRKVSSFGCQVSGKKNKKLKPETSSAGRAMQG